MQLVLPRMPVAPDACTKVYYATDGCNIKVGLSGNTARRGGELRVRMLTTFPGSELDERRHHYMWQRRGYRIGTSEWFRASDEILLWLTRTMVASGASRQEMAILAQLIHDTKQRGAA